MLLFSRLSARVSFAGLAALLALGIAAPAAAQGMYYKEILKDGRYYVFNSEVNAERFESSGEMGVAITMPGAGPNGATVVGDNERALQLFFFKHNIPMVVKDPPPPPAPAPAGRIHGLVFGDYYSFGSSHLANFNQQHGFWLRRAYLGYDHRFTPAVSMRLRLEMNSNGKMAGGSLTPYVKDAYIRWMFRGRHGMTIGIQPSLTFEFTEAVWGLRHIEKTPIDLYRADSSRDTGISVAGPLNAANTLKYAVQYGNESGNNAETNKFKSFRATARYETNPGISIEGMYGHFSRAGNADRTTGQIFVGYRAPRARLGFLYTMQKRKIANGAGPDIDLNIASGFGVFDVKRQKLTLFARVDKVNDPCSDCSGIDYLPIANSAPFLTAIAGLEYYLQPSLRVSPNIEYVTYDDPPSGAPKPRRTSVARLTFYWAW